MPHAVMTLGTCFCLVVIATCASAYVHSNVHLTSSNHGQSGYNGQSSEYTSIAMNACHKHTFKDPRCYTVTSSHQVYVMQCSAGTYFNNHTCGCDLLVASLPYDLAPVNCQRLHSQHLSNVLTSHATLSCSSAGYTFLESLKTQHHCHVSDSIWRRLNEVKSHESIDCVKKVVAELKEYYTSHNQHSGQHTCTCSGVKKYINRPAEDTSRCYYSDANFNHMYKAVFGSWDTHNTNTYGRRCASHETMWAYLDAVSKHSNTCFELLITIMTHAYQHVGTSDSCSCSVANDQLTTTPLPVVQVNHAYCSHYSLYTDVHDLIGQDYCLTDRTAFQRLNQLTHAGTRTANCAEQLISEMYDVFGRMSHTPANCSCSSTGYYSSVTHLSHCTRIPIYNELTSGATCNTHHKIWSSLNSLMNTDKSCLNDVLPKITASGLHSGCKCHAQHATTTTAPPVTQSQTTSCQEYSGYKELMKVLAADQCVSYTKVWGPLHILGTQRHACLVQAINHLASSYNHFDNRTCSCSHSGTDDLIFQSIHGGHHNDCSRHFRSTYLEIMTNVLGPHISTNGIQGYCMTHQTIWSKLHLLATTKHLTYCLEDLVSHLALSTQGKTDTCSCHPVSVTSAPQTQKPVTVPSTPTPVTTQPIKVQPCQKLETLIALAHNAYLIDNAVPCPSGGHSKSEATVADLCKAPASTSWQKGYNVLQHCQDIPQYTAIAAFAGNIYVGDGISGILISCNSTSLRIATERCDHPMEVVTVVSGARDTYTHMADNYYTLQW